MPIRPGGGYTGHALPDGPRPDPPKTTGSIQVNSKPVRQLPPMPDDPEGLRETVRNLPPGTRENVRRLVTAMVIDAAAAGLIPMEKASDIQAHLPRFFKLALEAVTAAEEHLS